ncbi:hypothetical protein NW760_005232 [Fusarium oxysporum]|nr:hypothetical protein NW769_001376 [Fusarium oxysporum]KAJ4233791.1 hypothetical protein NW760_005232 [Fusarium oxysporum]
MYTGVEVPDTLYTYQSDTDTDGSMHATVPEDISNLNIDATPALKRPESAITSIEEETEEPAAKKAKTGTKIPKRGRKASTQPSRASSRIRMQKTATASPAPSTAASVAAVAPASKAASKTAPKPAPKKAAGSKTATPAPEPDYDSSDPDR